MGKNVVFSALWNWRRKKDEDEKEEKKTATKNNFGQKNRNGILGQTTRESKLDPAPFKPTPSNFQLAFDSIICKLICSDGWECREPRFFGNLCFNYPTRFFFSEILSGRKNLDMIFCVLVKLFTPPFLTVKQKTSVFSLSLNLEEWNVLSPH